MPKRLFGNIFVLTANFCLLVLLLRTTRTVLAGGKQGVTIVFSTADVPSVTLSDGSITTISGHRELQYTLHNDTNESLVSVVIKWIMTFEDGKTSISEGWRDYTLSYSDGVIEPRGTLAERSPVPERKDGKAVVTATGQVIFAEFSDGRMRGAAQSRIAPTMHKERRAAIVEYNKLEAAYRTRGENGLQAALFRPESPADSPIANASRKGLQMLKEQKGMGGVIAYLDRVTSSQHSY